MDSMYIWIIVIAAFIVFTVIGYFVDRKQKKNYEEKAKNESSSYNASETPTNYIYKNIEDNNAEEQFADIKPNDMESYDDSQMSSDFISGDNYDIENIKKEDNQEEVEENSEPITPIETEVETSEPVEQEEVYQDYQEPESTTTTSYDENLEYLLGKSNDQKEKVESIDDFLQRTMKEVYEPNYDDEVTNTDMDYEDTLPIPVQSSKPESNDSETSVTKSDEDPSQEIVEEPKKEKKGLFGLFGKKKKKEEEQPVVQEDNTEPVTPIEVQEEQTEENNEPITPIETEETSSQEEQEDYDLSKLFNKKEDNQEEQDSVEENSEPITPIEPEQDKYNLNNLFEQPAEEQETKEEVTDQDTIAELEQNEAPIEVENQPKVNFEDDEDDEENQSSTSQIDFKPIEDAILESLGKLSEKE